MTLDRRFVPSSTISGSFLLFQSQLMPLKKNEQALLVQDPTATRILAQSGEASLQAEASFEADLAMVLIQSTSLEEAREKAGLATVDDMVGALWFFIGEVRSRLPRERMGISDIDIFESMLKAEPASEEKGRNLDIDAKECAVGVGKMIAAVIQFAL